MIKDDRVHTTLGIRIRETRAAQHISREALAERVDVSARFLADVEAGKVGISLSTLKRVCLVLGISADYLLGIAQQGPEAEKRYHEIMQRIIQIPPEHLDNLERIMIAFSDSCLKE